MRRIVILLVSALALAGLAVAPASATAPNLCPRQYQAWTFAEFGPWEGPDAQAIWDRVNKNGDYYICVKYICVKFIQDGGNLIDDKAK